MSDLYPLIPRLLFKRREYWKYCLSGHTCISLSETFSSSPKCTARFFRLVKRLSSDRLRFFLSLKYCIDFFTMLARRIFAGELFCNGNEKTSCCKTSQIWHSLVSHLMLLNSISSRTRRTSYPTFLTIFPILLGNSAVKVDPTCFNLLFAGRFSCAVVLLESTVVDCTI